MTVRIYHLDELGKLPKPEWLIEGVLHRNTIAVLAATKAAFKTFLAIDWGMNVALGRDWNGHRVFQGKVLHIVGEGGSGIWPRTEAWQIHNGIRLPSPSQWGCTISGVNLIADEAVLDLAQQTLRVFPDGIELLVVDTLARNQGGDENSSQQMSQLVRNVDMLRESLGCTVLFLHHFNRGGTFRGSSVLDGAFDTVILMDRTGDVSLVKCDKQKDAREFEPFKMKSKWINVPGVEDGSLVLEPDDGIGANVNMIVRVVATTADRGMTRDAAWKLIESMTPRPFGETTFSAAWSEAKSKGVIERKEGLDRLDSNGKGTLWVRNLAMIDLAA